MCWPDGRCGQTWRPIRTGRPADTRLSAALQAISGGTCGGCVYDAEAIVGRWNGGAG